MYEKKLVLSKNKYKLKKLQIFNYNKIIISLNKNKYIYIDLLLPNE